MRIHAVHRLIEQRLNNATKPLTQGEQKWIAAIDAESQKNTVYVNFSPSLIRLCITYLVLRKRGT